MKSLRTFLFVVWFYLSMAAVAVGLSPALLMGHRQAMGVVHIWARTALWGYRWIAGVKVQTLGREHLPTGGALVASKHQGLLDFVALIAVLPDPCFVLKKELTHMPFLGWFGVKTRMIAVDRDGHAKALKDMVRQARERIAEGRQVIIFPEGTRAEVGAVPEYKPGIAALYRDLEVSCIPVATDSGVWWPAEGSIPQGVATFEFLEPIPAGLKRAPFMEELEGRIESASKALLSQSAVAPRL
ncbi:lysophospholipid acyltransferase family protein [Brevundimonas sp. TWP2-3-4b1]|uniref:lysophospholipid acyltransferase family protein n=1 Tax=Brevundimonas sp. TWP2-3-4b1 TaxID=2804580 RepID=UPI003CEE9AE2